MKKFYSISFGCKVNSYETEAFAEKLEASDYIRSENEEDADIFVVNTCAVTKMAEKKDMEKLRSLANKYPDKKIYVMGCFAQHNPDKVASVSPNISVTGTSRRMELASAACEGNIVNLFEDKPRYFSKYEDISISRFAKEVRAFVKIQDGCDNFCSYCLIPFVRGKSRSRDFNSVLCEIQSLALNGYKEIVITGIDTASYSYQGKSFSDLIEAILSIAPSSFRVRISSLEAKQIDDKLISLFKSNSRLVPHIHLPLQSGSEKINRLMNRKYDMKEYLSLCETLYKEIPNLAISTDIITGFPSETEEDFLDTVEVSKKVHYMRIHAFPYSPRPFTKAYYMKDQVDRGVAKKRVKYLQELSSKQEKEFYDSFLGKKLHVLVEEVEQTNGAYLCKGYTENYLYIVFRSKDNLLSKIREITILDKEILEDK